MKGFCLFSRLAFWRKREQVQAIVELALLLPVLLAMASLIIDAANMIFVAHRLTAATREGARIATESGADVVTEMGTDPSCTIGACRANLSNLSTCCIAVRRAETVLINSGITNAEVSGEWDIVSKYQRDYYLLRIDTSSQVNFLFGLGNQTVTATASAYGDDAPIEPNSGT